MPSANLELVRSIYAAWNAADWGLEHFHPQVEWELSGLDQTGRVTGRDGLLDYWRHYWGAWRPGSRWEVLELTCIGDSQVLAWARVQAVGRSSGVTVDAPLAQLWTVRDGLIVLLRNFQDRATALEAAAVP